MSSESREVAPFTLDPTDVLELGWVGRQFLRVSNVLSSLTDGTGSRLKYIKLVSGTDTFPYTLSDYHHVVLVDTNGSDVTIKLPAGVNQKRYHIKNIGSGNTVTIDPDGTEQIDGVDTIGVTTMVTLSPMYLAEDSNWYTL